MENSLLNNYLANKGFNVDDLCQANALVVDNDTWLFNNESWLEHNVQLKTPDNTLAPCKVKDVIEKKLIRYKSEGCTSAIFVPLFSLDNKFVGLSIRKMDLKNKHDSWFIPNTKKTELLFNLNNAMYKALEKNSIIVTEGVYDTIALQKYGIANVVALLGTNMSNVHFLMLASMVDNIALCLDNDDAGINAMNKIVNAFKGFDNIKFFKVNIDKDPDEFLKENSVTEFKKRIIQWT